MPLEKRKKRKKKRSTTAAGPKVTGVEVEAGEAVGVRGERKGGRTGGRREEGRQTANGKAIIHFSLSFQALSHIKASQR